MTPQSLSPETADQLRDAVAWAVESATPLAVQGHGSKAGLGRAVETLATLDLSRLSGIVAYSAPELVLTARAGTAMTEITAALTEAGQHLAFEPPDLTGLLGGTPGRGTLGGLIATNLAGPRRIQAGAARDHFLGCQAVGGRAEIFKAGGKVVKNVTGFDLCKLLAGSYGTLAVLTEITVKVLPAPEDQRTVLILGLSDAEAAQCMSRALTSSHEVSAAAHLPAAAASSCEVEALTSHGGPVTMVRVEGPGPSVTYRAKALRGELASFGKTLEIGPQDSRAAWAVVRDAHPLTEPSDRAVWRVSVAPTQGPAVVHALRRHGSGVDCFYDWGGGLVWLGLDDTDVSLQAERVRNAVAQAGGGHATLMRASSQARTTVPVFQPQPDALAALTHRLKDTFDPARVLTPGRMAEDL